MEIQRIVVCGNPHRGYDFYGPFDDAQEALKWAEQKFPQGYHWIVAPIMPKDYSNEQKGK